MGVTKTVMNMNKQVSITIPYAVADFAEMRNRGFYYVDKTDYIPRLELYKAPFFCVPAVSARAFWCLPWHIIMTAPWRESLRDSSAERM